MIGRVLAYEVDDRHVRAACIVQIREAVPDAGTKMQESAGRFFGHAGVTIRGSRSDTFEQAEHTANFRNAVKGSDNVDFRSARVREARFNSTRHQGTNQTFCAIHLLVFSEPSAGRKPSEVRTSRSASSA